MIWVISAGVLMVLAIPDMSYCEYDDFGNEFERFG